MRPNPVRYIVYAVAIALLGACGGDGSSSGVDDPNSGPMITPPVIVASPASVVVAAGQQAVFSVVVDGIGPFEFQWFRNGQLTTALSDPTYAINVVQRSDSGSTFYVTISNFGGKVQSTAATLTVIGQR
jgi:hypothetical protein